MAPEAAWISLPMLATFIAMPAFVAWRRARRSRLASQVATELSVFAQTVRREARCMPLDESLHLTLRRLRLREWPALQLALELPPEDFASLAETAQRLALRLRRRVAFDRKMLARTASGLRRGAIAASLPPILALVSLCAHVPIPVPVLALLFLVEAVACALLWRLSSIEI